MKNITHSRFMDWFEERQQSPVEAVPTHLEGLNHLCRDDGGGRGFARGWFVTLGGNPGFGKSVSALNLCSSALKSREAVGYVSLEMTTGQLAARFYSIHSGEPISKLEKGNFDRPTWHRVREHNARLPPLFAPDHISGAWEEIVAFVKDCHDQGCRWFVLDYLQLVQFGDEDRIYQALTETVTDLRAWAVNSGSIIVALSQFNRATSSEYGFRPRSQGLWGGMILEASSDVVLLLDHSRYKRDGKVARTFLVVDKNRHGPVAEIPILWDYRNLRMREALPDEIHEWPGQR